MSDNATYWRERAEHAEREAARLRWEIERVASAVGGEIAAQLRALLVAPAPAEPADPPGVDEGQFLRRDDPRLRGGRQ